MRLAPSPAKHLVGDTLHALQESRFSCGIIGVMQLQYPTAFYAWRLLGARSRLRSKARCRFPSVSFVVSVEAAVPRIATSHRSKQ